MRKLIAFLALPLAAGCLSAHVPEIARWPVGYTPSATAAAAPRYGIVRVLQVSVRAPYDGSDMAVLRADGSVAFDAYNVFAAEPSQLLRGVAFDALKASGLFANVLNASSTASADVSVEVLVTRLALDCSEGAGRTAVAEIVFRLIDRQGALVRAVPASGEADAASGKYGQAFSQAVSQALEKALGEIR